MFLGSCRPILVWWPCLVYLVAAEEECGPWLTSTPTSAQEIDLEPRENAYLWFRPEEESAHVTFFIEPETIEPWSFVVTNTSLLKTIFLSQPTQHRAGRIVGPFITTTTFGFDSISKLSVSSNITVFFNVCTSPYVCAAPPVSSSSEIQRAVLIVFLVVALVVASVEAVYIWYRKHKEGAPSPSTKDGCESIESNAIYEEWNDNWRRQR
ncbi:uncharacterized protein [Penaeus vannamei]|uniref:uncharacterized protein n=1 Tax=Penaeus vannamei TaxID=6689 RepID=UPI00387FB12E